MTGLFNPPTVSLRDALDPGQRTRAAALLVAHQVKPGGSVTELLTLSMFVVRGTDDRMDRPNLPPVYGFQPGPFEWDRSPEGATLLDDPEEPE